MRVPKAVAVEVETMALIQVRDWVEGAPGGRGKGGEIFVNREGGCTFRSQGDDARRHSAALDGARQRSVWQVTMISLGGS